MPAQASGSSGMKVRRVSPICNWAGPSPTYRQPAPKAGATSYTTVDDTGYTSTFYGGGGSATGHADGGQPSGGACGGSSGSDGGGGAAGGC